jgi:D-arabinose 1-dehydrogenase-like Zn-dependent alcohol dehydrogenase
VHCTSLGRNQQCKYITANVGYRAKLTAQITVVPAAVVFRNQMVQGTLVSNMADVDETLEFAKRGTFSSCKDKV